MSAQELRKDITVLRAIAVLAVTLFHITHFLSPGSRWFQGGFLGVDIFFVISGFLMTMIIMRGLDNGNFSLYSFYKRRAKRICPALITVVVIFSIITIVIFSASYAERILKDGLRSLAFVSNFRYARLTGYFDLDSSERMFLHTWSLSVEWQFYLIYPILMLLLGKIVSRKYIGLILVALTAISFVFGCVYTELNPTVSYYYLPSRAFELLTGSLAYFYPLSFFTQKLTASNSERSIRLVQYAEGVGLICIVVSLIIVGDEDGWPNAWSILPMFGTWLCIAANNQRTYLANPVFQYVGLWSYAIYLVYWPIIVIFVVFGITHSIPLLLALIFASGILLHYGVGRRRNYGWSFFIVYFVAAGALYGCASGITKFKPDSSFQSVNLHVDTDNDSNALQYGNLSKPVDLIWVGDSLARQYLPRLARKDLHVIGVTIDGCYSAKSSVNMRRTTEPNWIQKCSKRYDNLLQAAAQTPDVPVVWAQNWVMYPTHKFVSRPALQAIDLPFEQLLKQDISSITNDLAGHKIYILSAARNKGSEGGVNFGINCSNLHLNQNAISKIMWKIVGCTTKLPLDEHPINLKLKEFISELPQNQGKSENDSLVTYIDVNQAFCDETGCKILDEESLLPTFNDLKHFSQTGAKPVINYVLQQVGLPITERTSAQSELLTD